MYNSYYYNIIYYKYIIYYIAPPVYNEISIHITSIYCVSCLQCSVHRSYNSLPQVGLISGWLCPEPVDVLCELDYPASSIRFVVFHKVVRRHNSGEVSEFIIFLCEISSGFFTLKYVKIGPFFRRVIQNIKRGAVFRDTM